MEFDWSERTIADWRALLKEVPRANFLQSWPFAMAVRRLDYKPTRLATVHRKGELVGMMALQEVKLGPINILNLYRGPLWFDEDPPENWLAEFAEAFNKTFPKRWFRRRRWMPEWHDEKKAREILKEHGFSPKEKRSYQTIWLDIDQPEETLRARLKQKWRNALNKGERSEIRVRADWKGVTSHIFLKQYDIHKSTKAYRGPSSRFIREELAAARPFGDALILWGSRNKVQLAGVLIFLHGQSATYHAGWTTEEGRGCNAHNVLLWQAIKTLKDKGIKHFDLGWIEPENASGLTKFKRGMGGDEFKLMGVFG